MFQIKAILVPVDFSKRSVVAAEHATVMAARFGARLILTHVIQPLPFSAAGFGAGHLAGAELYPHAETREAARQQLDDLSSTMRKTTEPVKVVLVGDPAEKIAEIAQQRQADLVMMPTHGYGPFRRFLLGSVTSKVLHDIACPVFTGAHVPEIPTVKKDAYRRVVCAINLDDHSETVLGWAYQFAQAWNAELTIVHAAASYFEQERKRESLLSSSKKKIEALATKVGCTPKLELDAQEVVPYVTETAGRIAADVLVIGRAPVGEPPQTQRKNAYALVRASPCAVISV